MEMPAEHADNAARSCDLAVLIGCGIVLVVKSSTGENDSWMCTCRALAYVDSLEDHRAGTMDGTMDVARRHDRHVRLVRRGQTLGKEDQRYAAWKYEVAEEGLVPVRQVRHVHQRRVRAWPVVRPMQQWQMLSYRDRR